MCSEAVGGQSDPVEGWRWHEACARNVSWSWQAKMKGTDAGTRGHRGKNEGRVRCASLPCALETSRLPSVCGLTLQALISWR